MICSAFHGSTQSIYSLTIFQSKGMVLTYNTTDPFKFEKLFPLLHHQKVRVCILKHLELQ